MFIVGTDAPTEGDAQPPVIYALGQATGAVGWSVGLADGMELQWGPPGANEGIVVFQSTAGGPGAAFGNAAHALEIGDGALRWVVDLGGSQGFNSWPTIVRAGRVALWGPVGTVSVDAVSGELIGSWDQVWPLRFSPEEDRIFAVNDRGVVLLDLATGEQDDWFPPEGPVPGSISLFRPVDVVDVALESGQLVIAHGSGVAAFDVASGFTLWSWATQEWISGGAISPGFVVLSTEGSVFLLRPP